MVGPGFDHHDGIFGSGDGQIDVGFLLLLLGGVDDELPIDAADVNPGHRAVEGDVADAEGQRGAEHAGHLGRVVEVDAHDGGDDLDLIAKAVGEKRADRAVDQAGGKRGVLAGAPFPAEVAAGDFARGVGFFFIVDGEGEEVALFGGVGAAGGRKDHGFAETDESSPVGLLCDFAGFNAEVTSGEFGFEYLFHCFS